MSAPSALEQYMLELINVERRKAGAQPLAFHGDLNEAADAHTAWMLGTDTFSHTGSGGSTATQRMTAAGYDFEGSWGSAENIAWASLRTPSGLRDEVDLLHSNLMDSPGHRTNLLNDTYREIGIGFATGHYQRWDSAFVTQDFARTITGPILTGVAFDDRDGDHVYDPGEGLGGLSVTVVSGAGTRLATTTTTIRWLRHRVGGGDLQGDVLGRFVRHHDAPGDDRVRRREARPRRSAEPVDRGDGRGRHDLRHVGRRPDQGSRRERSPVRVRWRGPVARRHRERRPGRRYRQRSSLRRCGPRRPGRGCRQRPAHGRHRRRHLPLPRRLGLRPDHRP